jgi:hypothetical protein
MYGCLVKIAALRGSGESLVILTWAPRRAIPALLNCAFGKSAKRVHKNRTAASNHSAALRFTSLSTVSGSHAHGHRDRMDPEGNRL